MIPSLLINHLSTNTRSATIRHRHVIQQNKVFPKRCSLNLNTIRLDSLKQTISNQDTDAKPTIRNHLRLPVNSTKTNFHLSPLENQHNEKYVDKFSDNLTPTISDVITYKLSKNLHIDEPGQKTLKIETYQEIPSQPNKATKKSASQNQDSVPTCQQGDIPAVIVHMPTIKLENTLDEYLLHDGAHNVYMHGIDPCSVAQGDLTQRKADCRYSIVTPTFDTPMI